MNPQVQTVEITNAGIQKILNKYTPERAISEYIWNGFDAKATVVHVDFKIKSKEFDTFESVKITDNGNGISYEELSTKFKKFYESQKSQLDNNDGDIIRGKNGYGRLTFYKFARFACWNTTYEKDEQNSSYQIRISTENLKGFTPTNPTVSTTPKGTSVLFEEISPELSGSFVDKILIPYLKAEFAWYLELKEEHKIFINGKELDYTSIIAEVENLPVTAKYKNNEEVFDCKYIRWNTKINDEYSRFYFLNQELELKKTKTTLLNKKGDNFWHSIIVMSDFFNDIDYDTEKDDPFDDPQGKLFINENKRLFNDLIRQLNDYLRGKRRPFLKQQASALINKYEQENVFPQFGNNSWDIARKQGLEDLVKGLYEVEPAVFMKLNKEQKRVFLELLNLVMDTDERNNLFKIIDAVVELDSNDRKEFAKILETTRLKQVISTIKLVSDRILTLENLKKLVFNHDLKAGEVKHLQQFIEKHYWIFGEEYRLVCAEEVKFEEALKKYLYILRGVDEATYIAHPDKYKEMDLFLSGTDFRDGKPHNVVVEIKNPTTIKQLKAIQVTQIETYMDVILKQDCFNDANEYWTFILIGQDYDDIVGRRVTNKYTGLIQTGDNYGLYVKKWSEIVNEVDRRLKYLLDKLQIERSKLSLTNNLDEVMDEIVNNSAVVNS